MWPLPATFADANMTAGKSYLVPRDRHTRTVDYDCRRPLDYNMVETVSVKCITATGDGGGVIYKQIFSFDYLY